MININGNSIGRGFPVYIIAELSANHNQDLKQAEEIICQAKACGANAIKLQTYTPDTITIDCDNQYFHIGAGTIWEGKNLYQLYREAYTPWEWQPRLKDLADRLGLDFFSSPFDHTAVDFLESLNVPAYKVASFELVDIPLIRRIARTGKPMIMSTGMATLAEIEEAIQAAKAEGNDQIALLKCTSAYPAPETEINLRTIPHLAASFALPVGVSDHTLGIAVPVAAVALGAAIVEKHLTLSRRAAGPDSAFSLEPDEFKAMVEAVRTAEKALGEVKYGPTEQEAASCQFRRSLFVVKDMQEGELFSGENVRSIRPGCGLHPRYLDLVIGRRVKSNVKRGTPLTWDLIL